MLVFETELHRVESVAFSPCGRFIAAGGLGVELWDVGLERAWRWGWEKQKGTRNVFVRQVEYHPSGEWVFGLVPGHELHQLRAADGEGLEVPSPYAQFFGGDWFSGHDTFTISRTSGQIASAYTSLGRAVWDSPGGATLFAPNVRWKAVNTPRAIAHLTFLADGSLLAHETRSGEATPQFVRLSPDDGSTLREVPCGVQRLDRLAASPDGRFVAGSRDNTVRVWSLAHLHRPPRVLTNDSKKQITDFAFHPGGRYLATVSNDRGVTFWDTDTWQPTRAFDWHEGRMRSLAFAPDGLVAAAGSDTGHVVLFDVDL